MSVKVMSYVWDHSTQTGTHLLMLLALADHANDAGQCWPLIDRLAAKCRVSPRQAIRLIQHLEAAGDIRVERGTGRGHPSVYTVKSDADDSLSRPKGDIQRSLSRPKGDIQRSLSPVKRVTSRAQKGDIHARARFEPSLEPSVRQEKENTPPFPPSRGALPGFESWWEDYPEKERVAEDICRRLWRRQGLEARAAEILAHTRAMRATPKWRAGYIPHSTTYLQEARYKTAVTGAGGARRSTDAIHQAMLAGLDAQGVTYERGGI